MNTLTLVCVAATISLAWSCGSIFDKEEEIDCPLMQDNLKNRVAIVIDMNIHSGDLQNQLLEFIPQMKGFLDNARNKKHLTAPIIQFTDNTLADVLVTKVLPELEKSPKEKQRRTAIIVTNGYWQGIAGGKGDVNDAMRQLNQKGIAVYQIFIQNDGNKAALVSTDLLDTTRQLKLKDLVNLPKTSVDNYGSAYAFIRKAVCEAYAPASREPQCAPHPQPVNGQAHYVVNGAKQVEVPASINIGQEVKLFCDKTNQFEVAQPLAIESVKCVKKSETSAAYDETMTGCKKTIFRQPTYAAAPVRAPPAVAPSSYNARLAAPPGPTY